MDAWTPRGSALAGGGELLELTLDRLQLLFKGADIVLGRSRGLVGIGAGRRPSSGGVGAGSGLRQGEGVEHLHGLLEHRNVPTCLLLHGAERLAAEGVHHLLTEAFLLAG